MASYNSKDGIWTPAIERVALKNSQGEPFIYEGPCRSAQAYLKEVGEPHLGQHFSEDPEVIERAHAQNKTVDEFCKTAIHTKEKREKDYQERSSKKVLHVEPTRKPMSHEQNGGAGLKGGFGEGQDIVSEAIQGSGAKK